MSTAVAVQPEVHSPCWSQPIEFTTTKAHYDIAIGYLRAFVTMLVVAHHAFLAYHPYGPQVGKSLDSGNGWWQAFPVVDTQKWGGFALIVGWNDTFFMALMFLLSGLFVWQSLQRKGSWHFLRDRVLRLGLPFAAVATVIAPLAYYPAYLQTGGHGLAGYWSQWHALKNWPAGPAWFLWVLLAFDALAAAAFALMPKLGARLASFWGDSKSSLRLFAKIAVFSALLYVPMELAFDSMRWSTFGPFVFQTSRILNYLLYFVIGIGLGAYGVERGLLAKDGSLARRWMSWPNFAVFAYFALVALVIAAISKPGIRALEVAADFAFVLSCAASSLALLALFLRFAQMRSWAFDSLNRNAYGIYVVHYAFVSWVQYAWLKVNIGAFSKGMLVFVVALGLSWGVADGLRRIPGLRRVL